MANSASISLSLDLRAFAEGLKSAISMGKAFSAELANAINGKARVDTAGIDNELKRLENEVKKLNSQEIDIPTEASEKGLEKVVQSTQKVEKQTKSTVRSIRDQFAMWGLAINGVQRTYQTIGRVVNALTQPLLESEAATAGLTAALNQTGIYSEDLVKKLTDQAAAFQNLTKYEDDTIVSNTALMQNLGKLSATELPKAQQAAIGLAAMTRRDIGTAFELMGKAAAGSFATLGKYGIVLDSAGSQQEKFAQLMEIGISKFPLAIAEAQTGAGAI